MQIIDNISKNITRGNKKAPFAYGGWALLIAAFIVFAYMPKYATVSRLKSDLVVMEQQIKMTEDMLGDIENLGHVLADMQKELVSFERRLPNSHRGISAVLSELSVIAGACSVDVISMRQYESLPLLDYNENPVSLDESRLLKMRIELELLAGYRELAEYIRRIQGSRNLLATIEDFTIRVSRDKAPKLDANLSISIYIGETQ